LIVKTFIVREAKFSGWRPCEITAKPWGLYVMKDGRNLHQVGHFETRDQAVSLAQILADGQGDIRIEN
jgi:hypothetical protein